MKKIVFTILFLTICTTIFPQEEKKVRVAKNANEICPILVGEKLPDITLKNSDKTMFNLNEAVSKQPTLLIFFRGGWCPYCNQQLGDLQKIKGELNEIGVQIIAVSADKPEILMDPAKEHDLSYTLLSDNAMTAAKKLGIAFKVGNATIEKYIDYGIDLEKDSGYDHHLLPVPAAFLIDTEGVINFSYVNPNYKVRVNSEVVLAAAKAMLNK